MKEENKKINFYRKWWFWSIIVVLICIYIVIEIINKNNEVGSAGISKDEFEKIDIGISQFELNEIIDKEDKWKDDEMYKKCVKEIEKSKEDNKYTYKYKYTGENGGYAIITLQADYSNGYYYNDVAVIKKENYGLK